MNWYHHTITWIKKYRAELIISGISTIAGVVIGKAVDMFLSVPAVDQYMLILLMIIAFLLLGQMFLIKRNVTWKIVSLQHRVAQIAGRSIPSQYNERKLHFAEEKHRIIENLIRKVLPDIVQETLQTSKPNANSTITVIVDSGTTLEQFFPRIRLFGLGPSISDTDLKRIQLYTNSLSGSDEFCKITTNYLKSDQLHLFGGTQMEKYRAVIGDTTNKAMEAVKLECEQNQGVIIGLVTANWLLVGNAYDKLIFCSTEKGHLKYKKCLAEISDVLIVVTPLGKLLKLDTPSELNTILKLREEGKPEYDGFEIDLLPKRSKENTFLLTTYRDRNNSILHTHSRNLILAHGERRHRLYTLFEKERPFILDHSCPYEEQIEIEMPHIYLREHAFRVLQIHR